MIYGAGTHLDSAGNKRGRLMVFVSREVRPSGKTTTTVTYERYGPCGNEPAGEGGNSVVNCPVLWTKEYAVPESGFTIDPLLGSARLTHTLQAKPLHIEWMASAAPRTQVNSNGNRFSESRQARAAGRWGDWAHTDATDGRPPSLLSRRVP